MLYFPTSLFVCLFFLPRVFVCCFCVFMLSVACGDVLVVKEIDLDSLITSAVSNLKANNSTLTLIKLGYCLFRMAIPSTYTYL